MSDSAAILPCVLIPVTDRLLLLPNVAIAEIVDRPDKAADDSRQEGVNGFCDWRGLRLPMVSYESANQLPADDRVINEQGRGRLLILNTISDSHDQLPFLALLTQGIPRQAKIAATQLAPLEGETGPADAMLVDFEGEMAVIPDLDYLEKLALAAMPGH
ncbi:MAG: chemotaxis protein CheW [Halomonadaceae bacterium]|nr:MAG: chemotaxis protein CheW [Halomonadaceae bacterium]